MGNFHGWMSHFRKTVTNQGQITNVIFWNTESIRLASVIWSWRDNTKTFNNPKILIILVFNKRSSNYPSSNVTKPKFLIFLDGTPVLMY